MQALPGDIELVQMATAVAGFSFLPYCQLRRGNIFVETFTLMLSKRKQTLLDAAWDIVYAIVAALMGWRLVAGALDAISSQTVSFQLGVSFGYLILVCAIMTGFLALTALYTAFARSRVSDEQHGRGRHRLRRDARSHRDSHAGRSCDDRAWRSGYTYFAGLRPSSAT